MRQVYVSAGVKDIQAAVMFVNREKLPFAVKGGGHSWVRHEALIFFVKAER